MVLAIAALFLAWYFVGVTINRRRANALARAVHHALPPLGRSATIKPIGNSAFQVEVQELTEGLRAVSLICLVEPRDFPLAWAWMRLRGHRDRMILKAEFTRRPEQTLAWEGPRPESGLRRLSALRLQERAPHLHLAFSFAVGEESDIATAFGLVGRLGRGEEHLTA